MISAGDAAKKLRKLQYSEKYFRPFQFTVELITGDTWRYTARSEGGKMVLQVDDLKKTKGL